MEPISVFEIPHFLDLICDGLTKQDITSCLCVCHLWYSIFQPYRWRQVRYTSSMRSNQDLYIAFNQNMYRFQTFHINVKDPIPHLLGSQSRLTRLQGLAVHGRSATDLDPTRENLVYRTLSGLALIQQNPELEWFRWESDHKETVERFLCDFRFLNRLATHPKLKSLKWRFRHKLELMVLQILLFCLPRQMEELEIELKGYTSTMSPPLCGFRPTGDIMDFSTLPPETLVEATLVPGRLMEECSEEEDDRIERELSTLPADHPTRQERQVLQLEAMMQLFLTHKKMLHVNLKRLLLKGHWTGLTKEVLRSAFERFENLLALSLPLEWMEVEEEEEDHDGVIDRPLFEMLALRFPLLTDIEMTSRFSSNGDGSPPLSTTPSFQGPAWSEIMEPLLVRGGLTRISIEDGSGDRTGGTILGQLTSVQSTTLEVLEIAHIPSWSTYYITPLFIDATTCDVLFSVRVLTKAIITRAFHLNFSAWSPGSAVVLNIWNWTFGTKSRLESTTH